MLMQKSLPVADHGHHKLASQRLRVSRKNAGQALVVLVSLGSLLGSAAIAVAMWVLWGVANGPISGAYPLYAMVGAGLIWLAHADNIDRLLHGTERKFDLGMLLGRSGSGGES